MSTRGTTHQGNLRPGTVSGCCDARLSPGGELDDQGSREIRGDKKAVEGGDSLRTHPRTTG